MKITLKKKVAKGVPPKGAVSAINCTKAKAEMKAQLAKGGTKAKTAKTTAKQQKIAAKIKQAQQTKSKLHAPGELARCRAIVGGDMLAAVLLYRIAHLWRAINPKMERHGKEWIAMVSEGWADSAGLSLSEFKNRALPRVRKYAGTIVEIRPMGNGKDKKLWATFDPIAYQSELAAMGHELKVHAQNGLTLYN